MVTDTHKALCAVLLLTPVVYPRVLFTNQGKPTGPTDPNVISDCTYWALAQNGDTCGGLENYFGLTQAQLIHYNPSLGPSCASLVTGNSYCVEENYGRPPVSTSSTTSTRAATTTTPTTPAPTQSGLTADCKNFYKVQSGDGCQNIVDSYGTFSLQDFYSWNPSVGSSCQGLLAGYYVCVGTAATPTVRPTASAPVSSGPVPEQTGIVAGCQQYYKVQAGDGCQAIVDQYGTFSLSQFYSWNPAIGGQCQNLQAGYYVCVGIASTPTTRPSPSVAPTSGPVPEQTGISSSCNAYYQAQGGDSCVEIANNFGTFSSAQFISWNPAVQSDCSKLFVGYYYCVGVPGTPTTRPAPTPTPKGPQPQQPGTISSCKTYYLVQQGDSCYDIEQQKGITAAQFNRWNPNVGADCSKLLSGYYVCVSA